MSSKEELLRLEGQGVGPERRSHPVLQEHADHELQAPVGEALAAGLVGEGSGDSQVH